MKNSDEIKEVPQEETIDLKKEKYFFFETSVDGKKGYLPIILFFSVIHLSFSKERMEHSFNYPYVKE